MRMLRTENPPHETMVRLILSGAIQNSAKPGWPNSSLEHGKSWTRGDDDGAEESS